MCRRISIFIFLIFALAFKAGSQNLQPDRGESLSIKDGLPDIIITSLCQDEDGFLWIGTANGLSRYDGTSFINFYHFPSKQTLPGNQINAIIALPDHRILVATRTGLSLFQTQKNKFINLLIPASRKMFPFENNFQNIALDSSGMIWAGTQTCLYHLDTNLHVIQSYRGFSENDLGKRKFIFVQDIKILPDGETIFRLQKKDSWKYYTYQNLTGKIALINEVKGNSLQFLNRFLIRDILFDKKGNAFFLKHLVDSLFYFNRSEEKIYSWFFGKNISKNELYYNSRLFQLGDRMLGCALSDGGLLYWQDLPEKITPQINEKKFLIFSPLSVISSLRDQENNLWIGTNRGLFKFILPENDLEISQFKSSSAFPPVKMEIENICFSGNDIFICTSANGFYYRTNTGNWKNVRWPGPVENRNIWSIAPMHNDSFRVATQNGLYWWNRTRNNYGRLSFLDKSALINQLPITTQFTDSRNLLWLGLGGGNGVACYDLNTGKSRIYSEKIFPLRYPIAICEDLEGNLWMGGPDGIGLAEWIRKKDAFLLYSTKYNSNFDNAVIYKISADQMGNIWMGTESGLIKFSIAGNSFKKFDISSGLASNSVYCFQWDQSGNLWIGTRNGLNLMRSGSPKIINFSAAYDLPQEPIYNLSIQTKKNRLYFSTDSTLYSLSPSDWFHQISPLKVFITGVTSSYNNLNFQAPIKLPYQDNNINISFTALNLINGMENEYFYKLDGITRSWIDLGHSRQIHFSNLAPGKYIFRVKAENTEGSWSSNERILAFTVASPFWESWWFLLLCLVLLGSISYLFYLSRIRNILFLQKVRNRIATDLHDSIGSTLTNISILSALTNAGLNDVNTAKKYLTRISDEAANSSQSLDDIVWSINSNNDTFEQMAARMRRYAAEVFEAANIEYNIYLDDKLSARKILMEQRRDVYLIFKESIQNIYKHAEATRVSIELKIEKNNFILLIKDNGIGFDTTAETNRNGVKNIYARIAKWNGKGQIDSSRGMGTTLYLSMSIG